MTHLELYRKLNLFLEEATRYNGTGDSNLLQARYEIVAIAACKQVEYPYRIMSIRRLLIRIVPRLDHPEHSRIKYLLDEILEASREMILKPVTH